jgi:hypothetical protein
MVSCLPLSGVDAAKALPKQELVGVESICEIRLTVKKGM